MKAVKNEQILIYNGTQLKDRQAYAYALSLPYTKTRPVDLSENSLTPRQIKEIANYLECPVRDLVDHSITEEYSEEDMLTLLASSPKAWNSPITITRRKGELRESPFEFISEQMKVRE